jgi:hypothetical protein
MGKEFAEFSLSTEASSVERGVGVPNPFYLEPQFTKIIEESSLFGTLIH